MVWDPGSTNFASESERAKLEMKHNNKNIWNNVFLLHCGQPIGPCKPTVISYLFPSQNKRKNK